MAIDPQLVERAREGDHSALGELLLSCQDRLYNVVFRMVGHREDALEVTQDTMLKVVEHIGDFKGQSQITTWMTRIAMNLAFSHLRKQRLRRTSSLDGRGKGAGGDEDQLTPLRDQLADGREPGPAWSVQNSEMVTRLETAVNRLQDDLRAVLVLRDLNEMDYQQIAQVLEIPVGTVKSRLFRARLALRQEMQRMPSSPIRADVAARLGGRGHDLPKRTAMPGEMSDG